MFLKSILFTFLSFAAVAHAQPLDDLIPGTYALTQVKGADKAFCGRGFNISQAQKTAVPLYLGPSFVFEPNKNDPAISEPVPSNAVENCSEKGRDTRTQKEDHTVLKNEMYLTCEDPKMNHTVIWEASIYRQGKITMDITVQDGTQEAKVRCVWTLQSKN